MVRREAAWSSGGLNLDRMYAIPEAVLTFLLIRITVSAVGGVFDFARILFVVVVGLGWLGSLVYAAMLRFGSDRNLKYLDVAGRPGVHANLLRSGAHAGHTIACDGWSGDSPYV